MAVLTASSSKDRRDDLHPVATNYLGRLKKEARAGALLTAISSISPRIWRPSVAKPDRIGVFCQWGVGDAILLLPLLRSLRAAFPDASLELIGKPWLGELFSNENCCDRSHALVPPWSAYRRKYRPSVQQLKSYLSEVIRLRKEHFDWLICPRFDPREILQTRLLRARAVFGFRPAGGRFWITNDLGMSRTTHDSMHRADLAAEIGRVMGQMTDETKVSFSARTPSRDWLAEHGYAGGHVLAIHAGAGHPIRRWHDSHFDQVLRGLTVKPGLVVFIEDPGNGEQRWDGPLPHVHWRGDLSSVKDLLASCDVFLGTDSGVMHMAAAAGCRVVTPFGPTEPAWFGPFDGDHEIVYDKSIPCRPCFDKCIQRSPLCMENIDINRLIRAVDDRLKKPSRVNA